jgi:guanylate kinase
LYRGTDAPEVIAKRLKNGENEIKFAKESKVYDHFLVNDDKNHTFKELVEWVNKVYGLTLKAQIE